MDRWEYCELVGGQVNFLGAAGLFADKSDAYSNPAKAWQDLGNDGWELVSVVAAKDGQLHHFFKRPRT
jgi:hypothetical protein